VNEADSIKEQKLAELQQQFAQQQESEQQKQAAEQKIESMLKSILEPEAKARLKNVKLINEQLYWNVVQQLLSFAQSGRIKGQVTEEDVKKLLSALSQKRNIKITRK